MMVPPHPSSASSPERARAALMCALQPFIEWASNVILEEVVRRKISEAMSEAAAEELSVERFRMRVDRLLPVVASDLLYEEVRWRTPEIAKDALVEEARSVVEGSRCELVWESLLSPDEENGIFRWVVMETFADIQANGFCDEMVDEEIRGVAAECYPLFSEARNEHILESIRCVTTEHTVKNSITRHLTNLLGSKNLSLLVRRALSLRTTKKIVSLLSDTLLCATETRHRLASEPFLAYAFVELTYRPACIEALVSDLVEDGLLERRDEEIRRKLSQREEF